MKLVEKKKVNNIGHILPARAAPRDIREMFRSDTRHMWPDLTALALIFNRGEAMLMVAICRLLEATGVKRPAAACEARELSRRRARPRRTVIMHVHCCSRCPKRLATARSNLFQLRGAEFASPISSSLSFRIPNSRDALSWQFHLQILKVD